MPSFLTSYLFFAVNYKLGHNPLNVSAFDFIHPCNLTLWKTTKIMLEVWEVCIKLGNFGFAYITRTWFKIK